jgi:hypothetical protein
MDLFDLFATVSALPPTARSELARVVKFLAIINNPKVGPCDLHKGLSFSFDNGVM